MHARLPSMSTCARGFAPPCSTEYVEFDPASTPYITTWDTLLHSIDFPIYLCVSPRPATTMALAVSGGRVLTSLHILHPSAFEARRYHRRLQHLMPWNTFLYVSTVEHGNLWPIFVTVFPVLLPNCPITNSIWYSHAEILELSSSTKARVCPELT